MSGRLSDAWLEELRSRVSLEEVVSEYVPLKQKGRRFWGCCPFHNEKTPSFSVDSEAQLYYCFGCHKGGTVINFVMDLERMDFMDAVRLLADRAHMELPERSSQPGEAPANRDERERMYEANRVAARYYHDLLWTEEGAAALNYLYGRGLNDSDIRRFGLGASPKGWDGLLSHLEAQGFESALLEKAGLVVRRENRCFDMFRGRVMFPIINAQGRVLGFGGRAMGDAQPKYLNTAETPIFNKRLGLYGLNFVKKERSVGHLVLVEGYMDTVSLRKYGVQGVVATLGTALTEEQARLMKRYAPEVWISYDGDAAGQKAALRALDILDHQEIPARVIDYPAGMDPDDFIKANGLSGFEALPRHDSTSYRMIRARDGLNLAEQEGMTQYALRCCAILKNVKSPIDMENHLRRLVNETGYDREILLRQIGATAQAPAQQPARRRPTAERVASGVERAEQELISMLAAGLIPGKLLKPGDFTDETHRALVEWLLEGKPAGTYVESIGEEAARQKIMQAINYTPLPEEREKALEEAEECLRTIQKDRDSQRSEQIKQQIKSASEEQKVEMLRRIMASMKDNED
ncbi:MAG: DNA primase [Clostridia bacterium]|nr:DNA primase [Clostridia bacterium]